MIWAILGGLLSLFILYRTYLVVFELRLRRERKEAADEAIRRLVYIYGDRDEETRSIEQVADVIDSLYQRDDFFTTEEAKLLIDAHIKKYHRS